MQKVIWIDADNSPHIPLFKPIVAELVNRGHKVLFTVRDFAQTVQLIQETDIPYTVIGKHYGKNKFKKIIGLVARAKELKSFAQNHSIDFAINHGSRSHVLACKYLGIPVFCGLDYEYTESFIFSKFATKMWIPKGVSNEGIQAIGVSESKVVRYDGYKEELYLSSFVPDQSFLQKLDIPSDKLLVTLRPPATQANYHNEDSEVFLEELIKFLKNNEYLCTLCLPRTNDQKQILKKHNNSLFRVLDGVVDGLNLAYYSDLVISGGGTMNREAALLGTPVYSIFTGEKGSLDKYMEQNGLIKFVYHIDDINQIKFDKKNLSNAHKPNPNLVSFLVDSLLNISN